jgi:sec-independent protein translocase protein TatC
MRTMESHNNLIIFINDFRKSIRVLAVSVALTTTGIFFLTPRLLDMVQRHLADKLYFFSVAGPFLSHAKLALFGALFFLMPWLMTVFWKSLGKPFGLRGGQLVVYIVFTCILFYAGAIFCYFVTLPLGINFLLGYSSEELQPVISVSRFVNFITLFLFTFGLIFELPIFMIFSVKVGVTKVDFYMRNRKYTILIIAIISAMLTPADLVTMILMAVPLYFLYEIGIILIRMMGSQEKIS